MTTVTPQTKTDVRLLEPGVSFRDPAGGAVVLVLAAPVSLGMLRCNGMAMVPSRPLPCSYHSGARAGTYLQPGRRYRDIASGLEVRCLRGGYGHLTFAHRLLAVV
jgi:hypothetical protein